MIIKKGRNKIEILRPWERWIVFALIFLTILAPLAFTQFYTGISFEDTGQIGDTIGGLTAPFINLLAAFLVYKSFAAQIKANRLQQENHNEQIQLILNEQSNNQLHALYDKIAQDYHQNEGGTDMGQAYNLVHGLFQLDKYTNNPEFINSDDKDEGLRNGRNHVLNSIGAVLFIHHSFILFLETTLEIINRTSDRNVKNVARYNCTKINGLFSSKNYNYLLGKNFDYLLSEGVIDDSIHTELTIGIKSTEKIANLIEIIMEKTNLN
ncbi:hypothetical protein [uncultured Croceitalea sp.]|uniref:hypothetical protein n=1 Tax=uncultured Croceitalea sp. TaxID=1798908 RepID=UPI00374E5066